MPFAGASDSLARLLHLKEVLEEENVVTMLSQRKVSHSQLILKTFVHESRYQEIQRTNCLI